GSEEESNALSPQPAGREGTNPDPGGAAGHRTGPRRPNANDSQGGMTDVRSWVIVAPAGAPFGAPFNLERAPFRCILETLPLCDVGGGMVAKWLINRAFGKCSAGLAYRLGTAFPRLLDGFDSRIP